MPKINLLDSSIYNLIAAGEVVERPASIVKELVENAIDAGAKNITVEIKNGGISYISVSDDGCGIESEDIKNAFLPHATSKIKDAKDLESIATLGFRGEALASIAAVAKVKVISKTQSSEIGTSLEISGGKFGDVKKVSSSVGTTMIVEDLFYCVPARAKFLKKPKTEEQEITNIISRSILANYGVNFTYIVDGKKQLSSLGSTKKEALYSIYGKEAVTETLEASASRDNVFVDGFIGKPTFSKSNRTYQTLIINGRYVVNLTVQTAVANAFGDFLMKRQYPFFVLYLSIPVSEVDVNVHPNKLDVKFANSNLVYSVVFEAVSRALHNMDYIKDVDAETNVSTSFSKTVVGQKNANIDKMGVNLNPFSSNFDKFSNNERKNLEDVVIDSMIGEAKSNSSLQDNFGTGSRLLEKINDSIVHSDKNVFEPSDYENSKSSLSENNFEETKPTGSGLLNNLKNKKVEQQDFAEDRLTVIGKIFNTYLIIEWGNNMYLIDQHAAHERLQYDKLKNEYENKEIVVQPLLVPYVLSLNSEDSETIEENLDAIRSVGFEIDEFGDRTYKISAIPAIVGEIDFNQFFSMFLSEKINKNKITEADLIKDSLMQMACKSAVKGGDDLKVDEIKTLLKDIGNDNFVLFCPHGRPVVVRIKKSEIEKWFKRIV